MPSPEPTARSAPDSHARSSNAATTPSNLVRNPAHTHDLRAAGVDPQVCNLEHATVEQVAAAVGASDAVVFAAGAGPGSAAARKVTMDRDGAIKLLHATAAEASHYVMLSGMGVEDPPDGDDVFSVYLRAKAEADAAVQASDRDWTIVRPGRLTDDARTGRVRIDAEPFAGEIARDDLAALLAGVLHHGRAGKHVVYVNWWFPADRPSRRTRAATALTHCAASSAAHRPRYARVVPARTGIAA